jgi:hypothetical protein
MLDRECTANHLNAMLCERPISLTAESAETAENKVKSIGIGILSVLGVLSGSIL